MRPRIGILITLVASAAAVSPLVPVAAAKSARGWATVNICDTTDNPDTIGIRASMPAGKKADEKLFIRFRLQYFSTMDDKWHNVTAGGDSEFVPVAKPKGKARQKGWSFQIAPNSDTIKLRGLVTMEWRVKGEVVRHATVRTHKGHKSAGGGDPPGYSAASCTVTK
jgi:hypothetical protein